MSQVCLQNIFLFLANFNWLDIQKSLEHFGALRSTLQHFEVQHSGDQFAMFYWEWLMLLLILHKLLGVIQHY